MRQRQLATVGRRVILKVALWGAGMTHLAPVKRPMAVLLNRGAGDGR